MLVGRGRQHGFTPTLLYLRQGQEVHRSTGAVTPSSVAEAMLVHA